MFRATHAELKSREKEIETSNEGIFKELDSLYPQNNFESFYERHGVIVSDGVMESAGDGVGNELMKSGELALIMASVQRRGTQSNSNSLQMLGVFDLSHDVTKRPGEDGVKVPSKSLENEEAKKTKEELAVLEIEENDGVVVVKPELVEVKKEEDSASGNGTPKWRRGRLAKKHPLDAFHTLLVE
ncbi:unnamed protein product [Rodentolepis nana]|uniref:Uncharacterized protein n=1 Tax=Rodentolepis nana TaxID=102285 RepID=A0A0R3TYP6_RODNA|nr:unnamed protein product [Rodentolepis nana]